MFLFVIGLLAGDFGFRDCVVCLDDCLIVVIGLCIFGGCAFWVCELGFIYGVFLGISIS